MNSIDKFFEYLGVLLVIVNAVLYSWMLITTKQSKATKYLTYYIVSNCIIQVSFFVIAKLEKNNLLITHIYFLTQFILLSLFYKQLLNGQQSKIISNILYVVVIALGIYYIYNFNDLFKFFDFEAFIATFPIIVYSVIHKYNSLNKSYEYKYVNTGILIYVTTSTLIFILADYISSLNSELSSKVWFINKVLYVGFLLLFLIEWKVKILPTKNN